MTWVVGIVGGLMGVWAVYTVVFEGGLETPKYTVVQSDGRIDVREYERFRIASTSLPAGVEAGQGFRVLARYIFGGNQASESMAMTAPVIQQYGPGQGLPTASAETEDGSRMAFVMSADRPMDQLPTPNSDAVELSELNLGLMASIRFSGWGRMARFQKAETKLRDWLERNDFAVRGQPLYAQYNSPSAFPLLRKNEVLLPISPR